MTEPASETNWTADGLDSAYVDWIERSTLENMKLHHQTADILAKEAATTLTVLLAGLAGSMAYAVKEANAMLTTPVGFAACVFAAWMFLLSFLLVLRCLKIAPIPSIYNEPANLLVNRDSSLAEARLSELMRLQDAIDQAATRNGGVAGWLNKIRLAAVCSPVVLISAWLAGKAAGVW